MEKIIGKFFLPENYRKKKKQVEGVIQFQPVGIMVLELSSVIDPDVGTILRHAKAMERITIWGIAANGTRLTLFECQCKNIKTHLGEEGRTIEIFQLKYLLEKEWVKSPQTKHFNKLSVNISRIDRWLNIFGGKEEIIFNDNNEQSFKYAYDQPHPIPFRISNSLDGSFYFTFEKKHAYHGYHLQQKTWVELKSGSKQSLQFFLRKLNHFIRFLNMVGDSEIEIRSIILTADSNFFFVKKEKYYEEMKVHFMQKNLGERLLASGNSFVIKYSDIRNFSEVMEGWFRLASPEYLRIIQILYECIENKGRVNMHIFLAICQAVEGYYRLVKKRIKDSFEKAVKVILTENINQIQFHTQKVQDVASCAHSIKLLRNDLTHIGKFEKKETTADEIHFYTTLLKNILTIAIFKKVGVDENKISIYH